VSHGGVFLLGEKELHLLDRNQPQALAPAGRDVRAAFVAVGSAYFLELWSCQPSSACESGGQLLLANRFQQVADRMRLERIHGVFVERGREDDGRRLGERVQVASHFDAIHSRHPDIEQHDVGCQLIRPRESFLAVHGLAGDFRFRYFREQALQSLARR
jgi:hypothetical protein